MSKGGGLRRKMLVATITAFVFGTILSSLFAFGAARDSGFLRTVERAGIDLGQRLYSAFSSDPARAATRDRILLVDIDEAGCIAFADEASCRFDYIAREEILVRLVNGAALSGAAAVVLDVILPDAAEAERIGFDFRAAQTRPQMPVLAPLATRMTEDGETVAWRSTPCARQSCGALRFYPASAEVIDGRSRLFPYSRQIEVMGSDDERKIIELPTLALAGARALEPTLSGGPGEAVPIRYAAPDRIGTGTDGHASSFPTVRLSQFDPDDELRFDIGPETLVIVGSSASSGGDIHETPVGPMAGMEVLANAIVTMVHKGHGAADGAGPDEVGTLAIWWTKFSAMLQGLAVAALTESLLVWIADRRSRASAAGRRTVDRGAFWDRWSTIGLVALVAFFLLEAGIVVANIAAQFSDPDLPTYSVDVIWPVVAVTLTALISFASKITGKIQWLVQTILDEAHASYRSLVR